MIAELMLGSLIAGPVLIPHAVESFRAPPKAPEPLASPPDLPIDRRSSP